MNPPYLAIEKPEIYKNYSQFHPDANRYQRDLFEIAEDIEPIPRVNKFGKSNSRIALQAMTDCFHYSKKVLNLSIKIHRLQDEAKAVEDQGGKSDYVIKFKPL